MAAFMSLLSSSYLGRLLVMLGDAAKYPTGLVRYARTLPPRRIRPTPLEMNDDRYQIYHKPPQDAKTRWDIRVSKQESHPTPQRAIRLRCKDCSATLRAIEKCEFGPESYGPCPLWQFRRSYQHKAGRGSRLKAIRHYCLWCCNGSSQEVKLCPSKDICALWPFRFGRRPKKGDS